MAKFLRPWLLTLTGSLLFFGWAWLDMSGMDYDGESVIGGYRTAGWFILGLPFLAVLALGYGAFFAFLARRVHVIFGWLCLFAVAGCMILLAGRASLPSQRLARVLGESPARMANLHHLREMDSFNGGTRTYGVVSGPENLLASLVSRHRLEHSPQTSLQPLNGQSLPDYGDTYANNRLTCYRNPESGKIWFVHRSRSPMP
jgi:hypothetical protein